MVQFKKVKVMVRNDKSKEELIDEAMRDNEEYFSDVANRFGDDAAGRVRREYRKELERGLKDYVQGEEQEIEMIKILESEEQTN